MTKQQLDWYSAGLAKDLPEGRVKTVTARTTSVCLVHFDGQWTAMDNHCPHQDGPLGEGAIEKGEGGNTGERELECQECQPTAEDTLNSLKGQGKGQ